MNGIAFRNLKIKKIIYEDSLQKIFLCKHKDDNSTYMVNAIINRKPYELVDFKKINEVLACFEYIYEEEGVLYLIIKGKRTYELDEFLKTHRYDMLMKVENTRKIIESLNQLRALPIHILCGLFNKHNVVTLENGEVTFTGLIYFEKNYLELDSVVLMNQLAELIQYIFEDDEEAMPDEIKAIIEKCRKRRYKNYNTIQTDFESFAEPILREIEREERKRRKAESKKTETSLFSIVKEKVLSETTKSNEAEEQDEVAHKAEENRVAVAKPVEKTENTSHAEDTVEVKKKEQARVHSSSMSEMEKQDTSTFNIQQPKEIAEETADDVYKNLLRNASKMKKREMEQMTVREKAKSIEPQIKEAEKKSDKPLEAPLKEIETPVKSRNQERASEEKQPVVEAKAVDQVSYEKEDESEIDEQERLVDAFFKGETLDQDSEKRFSLKGILTYILVMVAMVSVLFMVYKYIMTDDTKFEDKQLKGTDVEAKAEAVNSTEGQVDGEEVSVEPEAALPKEKTQAYSAIKGIDFIKDDEMKNYLTEDLWNKSEDMTPVTIDETLKHAGKASLKLVNDKGSEQNFYVGGIQLDSSKKDLKPEIRIWIQSQKEQSAILYAKVYKDGEMAVKISRKVFVAADNWMQYDMELKIGAGDYIQLYAQTSDKGTIWLDDYSVTYK